mmetsp:Transcript_81031/g.241453  ORF Transcript_81031/g.241453 Transcript_81031/m.241453 type:complete len:94 (+) Transcript_81031:1027-1308(+)
MSRIISMKTISDCLGSQGEQETRSSADATQGAAVQEGAAHRGRKTTIIPSVSAMAEAQSAASRIRRRPLHRAECRRPPSNSEPPGRRIQPALR